jgi:hypothetical protein
MTWKSRLDKDPPPQFFADVVAYLHRSYPQAALSRGRMEELKPFLITEWRNGQSAHDAAKATCACDGREIVPSPASSVYLGKKQVRPPQGAMRGSVFGLDELREPTKLAKLRVDIAMAQRKAEYEESKVQQAEAKLLGARSDGAKLRLRSQIDRSAAAARDFRSEERSLRDQLTAALEWAGWSLPEGSVAETVATKVRTSRTQKPIAPPPRKSEPAMSTQKPAGKKRCKECSEQEPVKGTSALPPPDGTTVDASKDLDMEALVNEFAAASLKDRKRA